MDGWFTSPLSAPTPEGSRNVSDTGNSTMLGDIDDVERRLDPAILTSDRIALLVAKNKKETDANPDGNDEVDIHIAQALNKLSMQERDQVYHDLHGVNEVISETRELVCEKLHALESTLMMVKDSHPKAKAFQMAMQQHSTYALNPRFQLMFLRAESFDTSKAADRMIRFFDLKLFLFGPELLCHDITMDHLSKDDKNTIKAGFIQLLPARDRAGRAVIMLIATFQSYVVAENMTRAVYYMFMCALDDEETQRRGMACIIYDVGDFSMSRTDLKTIVQGSWVQSVVPVKTCAIHHCYNDARTKLLINVSMKFFNEQTKARAKMHYGTHLECVYALMTFGIPPDALPVTMDGELKRKNHIEWIKMRKRQESMPQYPRIMIPSRNDVLFGRGKPFREHIGNLRLFNLLDENLDRYEKLRLKEKSMLIAEMVDAIRAEGGRFLMKQDGVVWTEVDDRQAKEKVSHAFRTRMRIVHVSENSDSHSSPTASPLVRPDDQPSHDDSSAGSEYHTKRARITTVGMLSNPKNFL